MKDAPESLNVFFDGASDVGLHLCEAWADGGILFVDIKVRLAETFPGRKRAEALHIAGLAQEVGQPLFLVVEDVRVADIDVPC